jgi:hypothetical protein
MILRIKYVLGKNDDRIRFFLAIENTGKEIEDMYFDWIVDDIRIGGDTENDVIRLGAEEYGLADRVISSNETHYSLVDKRIGKSEDLWWDSKEFQFIVNKTITLSIHVSGIENGQTVNSNLWWADADWTEATCTLSDNTYVCCSDLASCQIPSHCAQASCGGDTCDVVCTSRPNSTSSSAGCTMSPAGGYSCACTVQCGGELGSTCTVSGTCSYTCTSGWFNDDGSGSGDGCENAAPFWGNASESNTNPTVGASVTFSTSWSDNTGDNATSGLNVNYTWFSWNASGTNCNEWANMSFTSRGTPFTWHNETQTMPSACAGKGIAWMQYANDSMNRINVSTVRTITVFGQSNPQSCGSLSNGQSCQVNFTVNATQSGTKNFYNISINFTSSYSSVTENKTNDAFVCLGGSCVQGNFVGLNLSVALQRGILFGSRSVNTTDIMAQNDSTSLTNINCTEYWIGSDPSTTGNITLWHYALNLSLGESATNVIGIGNVTNHANQTANGVNVNMTNWQASTSVALTTSWTRIGNVTGQTAPCDNLNNGSVCYVAYWLDVPSGIPGGTYNTTYKYCGNLTSTTATCTG